MWVTGSARAQNTHKKMLSIEVCKQILKENGLKLNDSQIKEIREFLYKMGNIQYKENNKVNS